eukprot:9881594-Alexandrium_andersonii.AAC.1
MKQCVLRRSIRGRMRGVILSLGAPGFAPAFQRRLQMDWLLAPDVAKAPQLGGGRDEDMVERYLERLLATRVLMDHYDPYCRAGFDCDRPRPLSERFLELARAAERELTADQRGEAWGRVAPLLPRSQQDEVAQR